MGSHCFSLYSVVANDLEDSPEADSVSQVQVDLCTLVVCGIFKVVAYKRILLENRR